MLCVAPLLRLCVLFVVMCVSVKWLWLRVLAMGISRETGHELCPLPRRFGVWAGYPLWRSGLPPAHGFAISPNNPLPLPATPGERSIKGSERWNVWALSQSASPLARTQSQQPLCFPDQR